MSDSKIPYLKNEPKGTFAIVKEWSLFDGSQGCKPVNIDGLCLSMDKSPPPLPSDKAAAVEKANPPAAQTSQAPRLPPKDPLVELMKWAITPASTEKEKQQEKIKATKVKPFDLYDIPQGMKAEGFTNGEKFSQRWLDGRAYHAYITNAEGDEVEGRYAADMVDTDTVKLSWLRKIPAIDKKYQALLDTLESGKAIKVMKENFRSQLEGNGLPSGPFDALRYFKNDYQTLHKLFQFQVSNVSMFDTLLPLGYKTAGNYARNMGMSDVTASLANFAFYAAVAKAHITNARYNRYNTPRGTVHCVHSTISVTHVYVYAKDSYSFYDKGQASQYLGHWNKTGVVILPDAALASWGMKKIIDPKDHKKGGAWDLPIEPASTTVPPFPIDVVGKLLDKDIYYPIRNRDYREWRDKKGRGGDFIIFSDFQLIRLDAPIELDMGEVWQ